MTRWTKLLLLTLGALLLDVTAAQAQPLCGTCWNASDGSAMQHVFSSGTPTPPSGYFIQGQETQRFLESNWPELPGHQGHTYWLTGSCQEYHGICEPEEFASATSHLTPEALARWVVNTPGVEVGDVPGTVQAECHGIPITREVPYASWIMARATQSLTELGFPIAD